MLRWSSFAATLTVIYILGAGYVIRDELIHTGGGWINLQGMGTAIATAPSQVTLGNLLSFLGVPKINYNEPSVWDYLQLLAHLLLSAAFVYAVGLGLHLLARRLFAPQ